MRENWKPAPLRTIGQMHGLIANLAEFTDFLIEQDVKIIKASELLKMERSKNKKGEIPENIIWAWAKNAAVGEVDYIVLDGYSISCVEGLSLVAKKLLNKPLTCSFAYGSEKAGKNLETTVSADNLEAEAAHDLAMAVFEFFEVNKENKTAILPDTFDIGNKKFSPLESAVILSQALCEKEYKSVEARLCPAKLVDSNEDWSGWIIHEENFKVPNILEMAKGQMWTFKPAVF
jgi:hypothetical protein